LAWTRKRRGTTSSVALGARLKLEVAEFQSVIDLRGRKHMLAMQPIRLARAQLKECLRLSEARILPHCRILIRAWTLAFICVSLFLSPFFAIGAIALDYSNPNERFRTTPSGKFASWNKDAISYAVVGNKSTPVNLLIDDYLKTFSSITGKQILRGSTSNIFMIYDEKVFDDLRDHPDKFVQAGISQESVIALKNRFPNASETGKCLSSLVEDSDGNIIGAYVLSSSVSQECVVPLLFDIFGVAKVDSNQIAMTDLCVLYSARAEQIRTSEGLANHIYAYVNACEPRLRQ
jgi:hypothetical protein